MADGSAGDTTSHGTFSAIISPIEIAELAAGDGGIADMQHTARLDEEKIINHANIAQYRLCADSGLVRTEIRPRERGQYYLPGRIALKTRLRILESPWRKFVRIVPKNPGKLRCARTSR